MSFISITADALWRVQSCTFCAVSCVGASGQHPCTLSTTQRKSTAIIKKEKEKKRTNEFISFSDILLFLVL